MRAYSMMYDNGIALPVCNSNYTYFCENVKPLSNIPPPQGREVCDGGLHPSRREGGGAREVR